MTFKDLTHLPKPDQPEGLAPDEDAEFVEPWTEWLREGVSTTLPFDYDPNKPTVGDTLSRYSAGATCMKQAALIRDGVAKEPMDGPGRHVTAVGTIVHAAWQAALDWKWPGRFEFEVGSTIEDLTSGSADAFARDERHVLEAKTCGGFKWKLMLGAQGAAQGPSTANMVQLALNVMGLDAGKGTLVYLSNEAISKGVAERKGFDEVQRFGAQWTFDRSVLQPLADEWLEQLRWVRDHPTEQVPRFVPHEMPKGARLNPENGSWTLERDGDVVDSGQVWGGQMCTNYCPVGDACRKRYAEGE